MTHLLLAAFLLGGETPAQFGPDGLRWGAGLVTDAALTMTSDGRLLASRSQLESLGAPVPVDLGHGRTLRVDAGVRVCRAADGVRLSAHGGRRLALTIAGERLVLASPAAVAATARGFSLPEAGRVFDATQAGAAPAQDDADENIRRMQEAARRAREARQPRPPARPPSAPGRPGRFDWFRTFNPFVVSQPVSPVVVTSLRPASDIGF